MTGKELIQNLKKSGTGEEKLNVLRTMLVSGISAEGLITACSAKIPAGTLAKAMQIARDGEYKNPESAERVNIEDLPDDMAVTPKE